MGISLVKRRKHFCLQPKTCMYVSFVSKPWRICCKLIHSHTYTTIQTIFYLGAFNRNYNYGEAGRALKLDLLNHPEYIEQNATLAFKVAIWRWMTPVKKHQPSAHDVFIGHWKPTKNDTLAKRVPGFGTTMNVLYGDLVCGQDDNEFMNNIISHYLYYLDLMGVGQEEAGPHELLSCSQQVSFNPSSSSSLNGWTYMYFVDR